MSDQPEKHAGKTPQRPDLKSPVPTKYFVARGNVKSGPFWHRELQAAARDGTLGATDMVLPDGTQKWRAACEIPGLFGASPNTIPVATLVPAARRLSLFLSYRRADSPDTVKLIHERLKQRLPRWEIFYDHESIPFGDQFPDRLKEKVTSATAVLVIIGPKWVELLRERQRGATDHVRQEVRLALKSGASVVPVLVGKAAMPTDTDLAGFTDIRPLRLHNAAPIRPDPDFNSDLERIIAHLKQLDTDVAIGTILDDKYTLNAEIGVGGMGVVYLAQQKQPVKRTVAIKLIKPGMDSRDVLARFDAERQALAVMDHPNISKVLDAGIGNNGRPYFVMEYVKGVPITQYCDDKKLTPQDRLNLFIPICNAVQHAHQKGILHRDLKPSNVLVEVIDGKPVPKVIDFGLAKALGLKLTDKTLYTAVEARVGTLEYSAPEQAAGRSFDVDTRSDIYSLGVLLYELLTGAPPFTHEELLKVGEEEMRRVIREVEPTKPSKKLSSSGELRAIAANRHSEPNKLTRMVKGDLDWIVMKCLEKDLARRYETANQLGDELKRYLADEPVQAGPPSVVYRAQKFLRRNKGPVLAAGLVLFALIAGIIGTSLGLVEADKATGEALKSADKERQAAAAERVATQKALDAAEAEKKARNEAEQAFAREKLATMRALAAAKAEKELRDIAEKQAKDWAQAVIEAQDGLARRLQLEKHLYKAFEEQERVSELLREILELRLKLEPDSWMTFKAKSRLGGHLVVQRKYAEAESLLKDSYAALKQREKTLPPEARECVVATIHYLVELYTAQRKSGEAARWTKEFVTSRTATIPEYRDRFGSGTPGFSDVLADIGRDFIKYEENAAAEPILRECLEIRKKGKLDGWSTMKAKVMLGRSLLGQKKYADAEPLFMEVFKAMKQREKRMPISLDAEMHVLEVSIPLVRLFDTQGRLRDLTQLKGVLTVTEKSRIHKQMMHAGKIYVLDMESPTFKTSLKLQNAQGELLAEDYYKYADRSKSSHIVFIPDEDGTYNLLAASFRETVGDYTLRIREVVAGK